MQKTISDRVAVKVTADRRLQIDRLGRFVKEDMSVKRFCLTTTVLNSKVVVIDLGKISNKLTKYGNQCFALMGQTAGFRNDNRGRSYGFAIFDTRVTQGGYSLIDRVVIDADNQRAVNFAGIRYVCSSSVRSTLLPARDLARVTKSGARLLSDQLRPWVLLKPSAVANWPTLKMRCLLRVRFASCVRPATADTSRVAGSFQGNRPATVLQITALFALEVEVEERLIDAVAAFSWQCGEGDWRRNRQQAEDRGKRKAFGLIVTGFRRRMLGDTPDLALVAHRKPRDLHLPDDFLQDSNIKCDLGLVKSRCPTCGLDIDNRQLARSRVRDGRVDAEQIGNVAVQKEASVSQKGWCVFGEEIDLGRIAFRTQTPQESCTKGFRQNFRRVAASRPLGQALLRLRPRISCRGWPMTVRGYP